MTTDLAAATHVCVQVDVDRSEVEEASALLWDSGALAVQEIDLGHARVRLVAGMEPTSARAAARLLSDRWIPDVFDASFDGWLDAWRPFARPVRAGRVVVHPPWEPVVPAAPEVAVAIDPGRAFGQGSHPTTRLMLEVLGEQISPGDRVLDVGCGSGVLSVVAAVLGASEVLGVDVEPEAVCATISNAERNGVGGIVRSTLKPLSEAMGEFDLVLANILVPTLVQLAPLISERVADGGRVLLSGLLTGQREEVLRACAPLELVGEEVLASDSAPGAEWCLLLLRR